MRDLLRGKRGPLWWREWRWRHSAQKRIRLAKLAERRHVEHYRLAGEEIAQEEGWK